MSEKVQKAFARDVKTYEFVVTPDPPRGGAMECIYFSPDRDYVVCFFKEMQDARTMARLESITEKYGHDIFDHAGGDYWKNLFCWPEKIVEWDGKTGIVIPAYAKHFFFQYDSKLKGREKEGKWFASAKLFCQLDPRETGSFKDYLLIVQKLVSAVQCLNEAGLVHPDLSYKNVLVDPCSVSICLIGWDQLEIPGQPSSDILGTPDFIAPEILCDETKKLRHSPATMNHSLAVLIYMFLLHRHPLRGGRFFGPDVGSDTEEELLMGKDPLYTEHPADDRNRNMKREYGPAAEEIPWFDLDAFSAVKIAGPYLAALFEKAFIQGLKEPAERPGPEEWAKAIDLTLQCLRSCKNPACIGRSFFDDGRNSAVCPFCGEKNS